MNKKDEEVLDILSESFKKEAENTELPEALSKDNIVAMLKAQQQKEKADAEAEEKRKNIKASPKPSEIYGKKKSSKKLTGYLAAAAAFAIIVGAGVTAMNKAKTAVKQEGNTSAADVTSVSTTAEESEGETVIEAVTEDVTDEEGSVVATEVATDSKGNILTTIVNVLNGIHNALTTTAPVSSGETGTAQADGNGSSTGNIGTISNIRNGTGLIENAIGDDTNQSLVGYRYSQDGYYFCDDSDISGTKYKDVYDKWSGTMGMYIDRVRVKFEYEGKGWMVQLQKGQYGFVLIGAEAAVFTGTPSDDINNYTLVNSTDRPDMAVTLYYRASGDTGAFKTMFSTPYGKHCWSNGFVNGQVSKYTAPRTELKTLNKISFRSAEMAQLFADGLNNIGFVKASSSSAMSDDTYFISGAEVYVSMSAVHTGTTDGSLEKSTDA